MVNSKLSNLSRPPWPGNSLPKSLYRRIFYADAQRSPNCDNTHLIIP